MRSSNRFVAKSKEGFVFKIDLQVQIHVPDSKAPRVISMVGTREIANQEIETFKKQKAAQDQRIEMEQAKGTADMQPDLARSKVGVDIKKNNADARVAEATGEAEYIRQTGTAKGAEVEAIGLARARGYRAQVEALGSNATAIVNVVTALAEGKAKFVPDVLVTGGNGGGAIEGLAATAMRLFGAAAGNGNGGSSGSGKAPLTALASDTKVPVKQSDGL
jgi:hypothetical protein